MKKLVILSIAALWMGCGSKHSEFGSYGAADFDTKQAIEASALHAMMLEQDTVEAVVKGSIAKVCQAKGCWMNLDMGEHPLTVTFKDYGFFVPKNSSEHTAYIKGKAFVEVTSVAMLQERARDAEKSQEEIDAITEPQSSYRFIAEGVIIE